MAVEELGGVARFQKQFQGAKQESDKPKNTDETVNPMTDGEKSDLEQVQNHSGRQPHAPEGPNPGQLGVAHDDDKSEEQGGKTGQ